MIGHEPRRSLRTERQFGRRRPRFGSYKVELDRIFRDERRKLVKGILAGVVGLALFALLLYAVTVPASRREVAGSIVLFGTEGDEEARRYVTVQLDDGRTVWASVHGLPVLKIGQRARLIETTTVLIGMKRYEFRGFEDE